MGFFLYSAKPICTDSIGVEKIDRVTFAETETLFRCSARVTVKYSSYFASVEPALQQRIDGMMLFLNKYHPMKTRVQISIDETKPIFFKITDNRIQIGSQLLHAKGHLERGLIKIWLAERTSLKIDIALFSEVAADFLWYVYQGEFEVEDPLRQVKTELGRDRWPQVLKSTEGYCESPWKLSEHFFNCESIRADRVLTDQNTFNLSIRPLMTSVWIKAYNELAFQDRLSFMSYFAEYLRTQSLNSEKAIRSILEDSHPLKQGMLSIKRMTDLLNSSPLVKERKEFREFYSRITINLQQSGVSDSFAEAYFDYLFEYPDELSPDSVFFKNLVLISQKNPQLQIAVKDLHQIWILPTRASLPLTIFDQIKNQQHVYFACPTLKEISMTQFFEHSEKLLLVKGCDQNSVMDFESLITKGVMDFSRRNKNLAFIQFHLPSFEMKAKELAHVKNFFDLVKNRDVNQSEFQTLGWSQIQWFEESQAYKPNAVVDAIELFRIDIN
ncbi:MAG: hypothetical protein A2622_06500 [Bdellovibrionales bacterium RIFCSPHIGHO2_01_FULL_40_29]|nr:MAG: hypothetical protein A2622_06500 [Bdellovibrionales bacterium RIFCSPHIGHO2_01_FULL_40_29]OFZ35093.1 MAG: hypothetical protein A3D17_06850 [Bdellovibrionales bacterium RIFCSPHIGHO2_02_FULL_40_15]